MNNKPARPPTAPYSGGFYVLKQLWIFLRRRRLLIAGSALLATLSAALSLAPYLLVYVSIRAMMEPAASSGTPMALIGGAAVAAIVLKSCSMIGSHHLAHQTAYSLLYDLRLALARKLARLPLGLFQKRDTGQLKHTMNEQVERVEEGIAHLIPDTLSSVAVPLIAYAAMFALDWRLALAAAAAAPLLFIAYRTVQRKISGYSHQYGEAQARLSSALFRYVNGMKVIKAFARSDYAYGEFAEAVKDSEQLTTTLHLRSLKTKSVTVILSRAPLLLVLPLGTLLYANGSLSLATLVFFMLVTMGIGKPLLKLMGTGGMISFRIAGAVREVVALLEEKELPEPKEPKRPLGFAISLDEVSFGYGGKTVLNKVNLHVPEGKLTALVGPSGAGKSTIARLIARFWDADGGTVSIGGTDVRDMAADQRMALLSFVFQDEFLFEESILENIRKGRVSATDEEVIEAAKTACCHDWIMQLPEQYDTVVGQQGGTLSGGERQLIAIARAIVKDAPIVILDEATAFVDPENEGRIREALSALMNGSNGASKTMLMIAHRLSSIVHADQIVVMNEGTASAAGTHAQLLHECELYRQMWNAYQTTPAISSFRSKDHVRLPAALPTEEGGLAPSGGKEASDDAHDPDAAQVGWLTSSFRVQLRQLAGGDYPQFLRSVRFAALESPFIVAVPLCAAFAVYGLWTGNLSLAWSGIGLLLAAFAGQGLLFYHGQSHALRLEGNIRTRLRGRLGIHLRKLPLGFYDTQPASTIESRLRVDVHNSALSHTIAMMSVRGLLAALITAFLLFALDWRLACVALAGVPLSLVVTAAANRKFADLLNILDEPRKETNRRITEYIRGIPLIQAFGLRNDQLRPFIEAMGVYRDRSIAYNRKLASYIALDSVVFELGFAAVLAVGTSLYAQGSVDPLTLALVLLLTLGLYEPLPLLELAGFRRLLQRSLWNLNDIFGAKPLPEPLPNEEQKLRSYEIAFDQVSFSYGERPILQDITLRIPEGKVTALVGPSGSGKTTLLNLISRFWDVHQGSVTIGGADVRRLRADTLMSQLSMVFQDVYLFKDTLLNNIRFGRPDATDEEVYTSAGAARCHDFIRKLPEGYATVAGEGGGNLSGGERQRVSIARALLKDAPVLLLDEATASIDPGNELLVTQALQELANGKTVVVIAHRLHTIRGADQIIVLEKGRVIDAGGHAELLERCGLYQRFWHERLQAETREWNSKNIQQTH
ncbi:ABC transporter ATP-binding protein [Paenibacillus eucommiae]|uniref:ABC-type multidrug transport system fused ATPase/permease subunit n=1 Tax=Paenibacillus eucommiae TaxID=1355755 RepID=A0ABS4J8G0_9BACL|nr:ABC transporter ATP-binding protein [Paenibacillus eucommiae]MBP1996125.1 ABC-type multidrug transport system fused ATPase/permease subunit [Paenibacillus eucommiae]